MPFSSNHKIAIVDASGDPCDNDAGKLNVVVHGLTPMQVPAGILVDGTGAVQVDIAAISSTVGFQVQGYDGSSWQDIKTDADGHLQVDILSGGGGEEQYADGTVNSGSYKGTIAAGTDGANYQFLKTDTNGRLQIDVLSAPTTAVTNTGTFAVQIASVEEAIKSEDSVHSSGDKGIMALAVNNVNRDILSTDSGDYSAIAVDRYGFLPLSSHTGAMSTLIKDEDSSHSSGNQGIMALAVSKNTFASNVGADGDYASLLTSSRGALYVEPVGSVYVSYAQIDVDNALEFLKYTSVGTVTNCSEIILQADHDNTGYIMIGDAGGASATEGIRLEAGDTFILGTNDTRNVSMWGSAANQNLNCSILKSY